MITQTWEQQRAASAWSVITDVRQRLPADQQKLFGTQTKKLPVRILTSGLGPALAFLRAKGKTPDLESALNQWINQCKWAQRAVNTSTPGASLMLRIIESDAEFLRLATDECMAYLQWLVRFAEAEGLVDLDGQENPGTN